MDLYINARTNEFRVRNITAFLAHLRAHGITHGDSYDKGCDVVVTENDDGTVVLFSNTHDGAWPDLSGDSAPSAASLADLVGSQLASGEIARFISVGSAGVERLWAEAVLVNAQGRIQVINLDEEADSWAVTLGADVASPPAQTPIKP